MDRRSIVILGSTGSIGTSTLDVVSRYPDRFSVLGLAGGDNLGKLADQIRTHRPRFAATRTEEGMQELRANLGARCETQLLAGVEGAQRLACLDEADVVVSAVVGAAGLRPTLKAVEAGKTVALANKESMVVAGALVRRTAERSGARILPVDSEHSAIFQILQGSRKEFVRRLLLTASGGPFFRQPDRDLSGVSPQEALEHPNWEMGDKITIDSATMMNKGLEIIEARWLFGFPPERIDVVVHPQSIVHSMVEFVDGSVLAQLSVPDMRGPIAHALAYPERLEEAMPGLDLAKIGRLEFFEPDHRRFPSVRLAVEALRMGETYPAVLNGANEVTVRAFLDGRIGFTDIPRINRTVLQAYRQRSCECLEDFLEADAWGRREAARAAGD
jgi:1-deoxy-D-xylulose-5-phosphate reductoisomerase